MWQWDQDHGPVNGTCMGACGSIKDHPVPVRQFDEHGVAHYRSDSKKRRVTADVSTYRGVSIGASHWYAEVREEHNRVLKLGDPGYGNRWQWAEFPDDSAGEGKRFRESFDTKQAATDAMIAFVRENFKPETHEVQGSYGFGYEKTDWWGTKGLPKARPCIVRDCTCLHYEVDTEIGETFVCTCGHTEESHK